jgi:hypothetical protein
MKCHQRIKIKQQHHQQMVQQQIQQIIQHSKGTMKSIDIAPFLILIFIFIVLFMICIDFNISENVFTCNIIIETSTLLKQLYNTNTNTNQTKVMNDQEYVSISLPNEIDLSTAIECNKCDLTSEHEHERDEQHTIECTDSWILIEQDDIEL